MAYNSAFAGFGHSGDDLTRKIVPAGMCLVMAAECGISTRIGIEVRALYNLFRNTNSIVSRWIYNPRLYQKSLEAHLGFRIRIYEAGEYAPNFTLHLFMASNNDDGTSLICKSGVYSYPAPNVDFLIGESSVNNDAISDAYDGSLVPTKSQALAQMTTNPSDHSEFYWNIVDNYPYTFDTAMAQGGWLGGRTVFYNFSCRAPLPGRRIPARQQELLIGQRRAASGQQQEAGIFRAGPVAGLRARFVGAQAPAPARTYRAPTIRDSVIQTLVQEHPEWTLQQIINAVNGQSGQVHRNNNAAEPHTICNYITGLCTNMITGVVSRLFSRRGGRRTRRRQNKKNKTRSNKHKRSTKTRRV
jgi:hypothetical protein